MALACLAFVGLAGPSRSEVKIFPDASDINKYSSVKFGREGRVLFDRFKRGAVYFGAFYYNEAEDVSWFMTGVPKLEDAISVARAECERLSSAKGQCKLHALIVPKGFSSDRQKGFAMSRGVAKDYVRNYLPKAKQGGHSAFSTDGLGGFGFSHGYTSAKDAAEVAQLQCLSATTSNLLTFGTEARALIHKLGADVCKVVDQQKH